MNLRLASTALPFLVAAAHVVSGCSGTDTPAPLAGDGPDASTTTPDAGGPAQPPLPPPTGVPGSGDGLDAGPDASAPADPCTSERPDAAAGMFVAVGGAPAPACGASDKPCGSVSDAIDLAAKAGRTKVYVAAGLYDRETVTLKPGVTVQGGWNRSGTGSWTRDCSASASAAVTLRAPATADRTVVASFAAGAAPAALETLSIESKAFADRGQSLYGLFVTGAATQVRLDRVKITVRAGGDGEDGMDAVATPAARSDCAVAADGHTALVPGADGAGAAAGAFTPAGYAAPSAKDGLPGAAGANGTHATEDLCVSGKPCTPCTPGKDCDVVTSLAPPPDLGATSCVMTVVTSCGNVGTTGCGGAGGARGTAGKNGGSSVAVFVSDGSIVVSDSALSAAKGGAGGHGGKGALGGKGAPEGTSGTAATTPLYGTCVVEVPKGSSDLYYCVGGAPVYPKAGAKGGPGGDGSAGGGGGGGAGGFSYSYVVVGSGSLNATGTEMAFKEGGVGGVGGAAGSPRNDGTAGVGGVRN